MAGGGGGRAARGGGVASLCPAPAARGWGAERGVSQPGNNVPPPAPGTGTARAGVAPRGPGTPGDV